MWHRANRNTLAAIVVISGFPIIAALFAGLILLCPVISLASAAPSLPARISADSSGAQANAGSGMPSISADGRYIAFLSSATNLIPGGTIYGQVFLKDTLTGSTSLISSDAGGNYANCSSGGPSISADGKYVAFVSCASNLVPGDTNDEADIFKKDTQTGAVIRVSTDSYGGQANQTDYHYGSNACAISGDGRYVAFQSYADNLVPDDTNFTWDVFVKDAQTGLTTRISTNSSGLQAQGLSQGPFISGDGRYVGFIHSANLIPGGSPGTPDIFIKDLLTGITSVVSTDSNGVRADGGFNGSPSMTPDGNFVAFYSTASNLVPDDTEKNCISTSGALTHCAEIYIKNIQTGQIWRASNDYSTGGQPNGQSFSPSVSNTGRVLFWSFASNLVPGDTAQCSYSTPTCADVFVWDLSTGKTTRVSTDATGAQGNRDSGGVGDIFLLDRGISADGKYVVFEADATNLVPGDTNNARDIFLTYTDERNTYWPWYDALSPGVQNWLLMANAKGNGRNLGFGVEIAGEHKDISDFALSSPDCSDGQCAAGEVPLGSAITPSFPGVMGGPVKVRTGGDGQGMLTSQRVLWGDSLEEIVGIDESELTDHYYWPWYDQLTEGFTDWVLVSNPNYYPVFYQIRIAGQVVDSGTLPYLGSATPTFPDVMGGPVEVIAWRDQIEGSVPADVIASQRLLTGYGRAFSEVPGIPAGSISDHYLWTWYDYKSPGAKDWIMLANPNASSVQYSVKVAGNEVATGTLEAAGDQYGLDQAQLSFPDLKGGPVEVTATGNIIASQRSLWNGSFEEIPGFPYSSLASQYHWTWYDSQSPGALNWVMITNPNAQAVNYTIRIGGNEVWTDTLEASGDSEGRDVATRLFPGSMDGPVEVTSTGGNVFASQRVLWKGNFNEVVGAVVN